MRLRPPQKLHNDALRRLHLAVQASDILFFVVRPAACVRDALPVPLRLFLEPPFSYIRLLQPGSMPFFRMTGAATGELRYLTNALAAVGSFASTKMPLENTVKYCTSAGSGPR